MRKMIFISMMSAALFAGACKKKDDSAKAMDRAATSAQKAQESVNDQAKDVHDEQKDVAKDQQAMAKDQGDVAKEQRDVDSAKTDLVQARDRYRDAAKQRLAKLDDDIKQLEAKSDAAAKDTAVRLRGERDAIATKLNAIGDTAQANWDSFKKEMDDRFDKVEGDARDALKK
ncbi:MAG TPA: hypothetical protein VK601_12485 [Kofleriaceae bacterium]|nr:hypothetical protein [Kofleriaceae bacterium]